MTSRQIVNVQALVWLGTFIVSTAAGSAPAAPSYSTTPLPEASGNAVPPSRFPRRPDYRQLEQQQAAQQQQAQKPQPNQQNMQQTQAAAQAKQLNQKAVALGKAGKLAQAIQLHEKAVQLAPADKQLRINLSAARAAYGKQRLSAGDLNAACTLFRKALAAAPDNGLAGKLLSDTLKRQGKNPASADVRLQLGDELASAGDFEGAAVEYEAAMQLEQSARTYTKVGDIALRYGQTATAVNWYQQALIKDPNYGPAYRQLGYMQAAQGDYTGAASSLRKALIWNPQDSAAAQVLVELWRRQVAAANSAQNHLGLAGALQLSGDLQGAAAEYREVQALDPKNPELEPALKSLAYAAQHQKSQKHYEAAQMLFGQGLIKDALAEVGQAVMSEPRNAKYQFLLGQCLESSGNYDSARQAYLSCVLIDPQNSREAAARLHDLETTMNSNKKSSSLAAPQENVNNAEPHHNLAVRLLNEGRISEAISQFRMAADLNPGNKSYAEDLDQAIIIHKKAMAGNSDATAYDTGRVQQ